MHSSRVSVLEMRFFFFFFFLEVWLEMCNCIWLSLPDVGGKVIHLVERAPPPPSQPGSGSGGSSAESGPSSSSQGTSQVPPHDRNANSYVMLGTFNLPVNIMDPQQIQVGLLYLLKLYLWSNVTCKGSDITKGWWKATQRTDVIIPLLITTDYYDI